MKPRLKSSVEDNAVLRSVVTESGPACITCGLTQVKLNESGYCGGCDPEPSQGRRVTVHHGIPNLADTMKVKID